MFKKKCVALTAPKKFDDLNNEALEYLKSAGAAAISGRGFVDCVKDNSASNFSIVWALIFGDITIATALGWLLSRGMPRAVPGLVPLILALITVGVPAIACSISYVCDRHSLAKSHKAAQFQIDVGKPTEYIPLYLSKRLEDDKRALIGKDSEFSAVTSHARALLYQIKTLQERLEHHLKTADATAQEFLREGLVETDGLAREAQAQVDGLDDYCAKVEAFFAERRAEIGQLVVPLVHYELMVELSTLKQEVAVLKERAAEVVTATTAKLVSQVVAFQDNINRELGDGQIRLALAVASSGDLERDLQTMDRVISGFNKAAERIPIRALPASSDG